MGLESMIVSENQAKPDMSDDVPIILLDKSTATVARRSTNMNITELSLDVLGEPVQAYIGFLDGSATLADVVPMARLLSTWIGQVFQRGLSSNGTAVPCRKGCAVCCYYLVSLSVPEAFRLMKEVMVMSSNVREDVMASCLNMTTGLQKYLSRYYMLNKSQKADNLDYYQVKEISDWYFRQQWPCPFLCNNVCTIYEQRPIVCREHMVAGSSLTCQTDGTHDAIETQTPIGIEIALKLLSSALEQTHYESVPLPCVFDWYHANAGRSDRTWPAKVLVENFIEAVHKVENLEPV
jgi:Fe-S-cluster containining protein